MARQLTTATNVEYHLGPAFEVVGGRHFDVALLVHFLEHIDDAPGLLRQMHDVADLLVIEVPDFDSDPLNIARLAMGRSFSSDADHVREFTEATLTTMLATSGWHVGDLRKRAWRQSGNHAAMTSCSRGRDQELGA